MRTMIRSAFIVCLSLMLCLAFNANSQAGCLGLVECPNDSFAIDLLCCTEQSSFKWKQPGAIWKFDLQEQKFRQLTEPGNYASPIFSPDSQTIAYVLKNELWLMNADGSEARKLYGDKPVLMAIAWSTDTPSTVAFMTVDDTDAQSQFWSIVTTEEAPSPKALDEEALVDREEPALLSPWADPRKLPDGRSVEVSNQNIFLNKPGSDPLNLTWTPQGESFQYAYPALSPDGKYLVFVSNRSASVSSSVFRDEDIRKIRQNAVIAYGGDTQKLRELAQEYFLKAYLDTLPQDCSDGGAYYFVEGDLRMTEKQIKRYLKRQSSGEALPFNLSSELSMSLGMPIWPMDLRELRYVVDPEHWTEEQAERAAKNFQEAAEEWMAICPECGIVFKRLDLAEHEQAVFTLRYSECSNGVIARAFYPDSSPDNREVVIFPEYFSLAPGFDPIGIMRHEIGHILGYQHEHLRDEAPSECAYDASTASLVPLTPYDPQSVMHYFCGEKYSLRLELSDLDKQAHRDCYSPENTSGKCEKAME